MKTTKKFLLLVTCIVIPYCLAAQNNDPYMQHIQQKQPEFVLKTMGIDINKLPVFQQQDLKNKIYQGITDQIEIGKKLTPTTQKEIYNQAIQKFLETTYDRATQLALAPATQRTEQQKIFAPKTFEQAMKDPLLKNWANKNPQAAKNYIQAANAAYAREVAQAKSQPSGTGSLQIAQKTAPSEPNQALKNTIMERLKPQEQAAQQRAEAQQQQRIGYARQTIQKSSIPGFAQRFNPQQQQTHVPTQHLAVRPPIYRKH